MQPHSISALAVAHRVFGINLGEKLPEMAEVQIDWKDKEGKTKSIFHFITKIEALQKDENGYITKLGVSVKTTDGTICTLSILRSSDGEFKQGQKLSATHSVQHRAGLEERYELSRKSIRGEHFNSEKYGNFSSSDVGENAFVLECQVKKEKNIFIKIPYRVTVRVSRERYLRVINEEEQAKKKGSSVFTGNRFRK